MAAETGTVWVSVVSSAVGGIMAITGGIVTQLIIAGKEKCAHERKLASELADLGSQLLVRLMEFRDRCHVYIDCPELAEGLIPSPPALLSFNDDDFNWSVLPGELLLGIMRLPLHQNKFNQELADCFENPAVTKIIGTPPRTAIGGLSRNVRR